MANEFERFRRRGLFFNPPPVNPYSGLFPGRIQEPIATPLNPPESQGLLRVERGPTPAMDEFRAYLASAPRREDYNPGKLGKFLAAAAGTFEGYNSGSPVRGFQAARGIIDDPYERAFSDYERKGSRLASLADIEYKTGREQAQLALDINKQIIDAVKAESDIDLNEARASELRNRIKSQGKRLERNEVTGQLEVVDITDGSRMSIGQFNETPTQRRTAEHTMFKKRHAVEQAGRERLEGIRFGNDERLARLRQELADNSVSPQEDNSAFEGAYKEILTENPNIKNQLFEADDQGNLILKEDYDEGVYGTFITKVKLRKQSKLGRPTAPTTRSIVGPSKVTEPTVTPPSSPEEAVLRETAIKFLRDNDFVEDEESIQEAMRQISAQSAPPVQPPMNFMFGQGTQSSPLFQPSEPTQLSEWWNRINTPRLRR